MAKDKLTEVLEKTDGKRAKTKTLDKIPTDTKSRKLPTEVIKAMSEKFPSAKLSTVKVHVGAEATEACKTLGAKAFISGSDIFLAKSGDAKDSKLLAHELSHVLQQTKGKVPSAKKGKVLTSK
ncbi:DUF4157 domain-containing protein [Sulfitobacter sp. M57]|uniref:eCIS core domain-containing protein n=1 Tax=unclassified Sulfitobacter TaxID=196795 RepID=UPI0023E2A076|nr:MULTISPECIES: DUF4157 domain-containing protein [unclassified Sulfitobacter]MDF3416283.1 DUF4157 domain-containing protein [Sulfitobacter sp. KE5]MDF3423762.1 DUF4157 domain-containing protein [Sulfitobacter sp. KE43]MDF3434829.1 DUF4157 domain-containing protein [Sulfitobacter sp. KE42]MDF3460468.1 DUF4157 domain-containing protein [Sulfitobacter sp. S74]MDF3464366.1 DUF4157 domain-containing protein [Sulfitobacter sp. Ks18]